MANALKKADEYVTNALIGTGYGIQNQLEGMYQMAANPRETFAGFRNMLTNPRQIPGMVANSLVDSYRRASSGPLGFGEVLGENLSPSMFRRGPTKRGPISQIDAYHGTAGDFDAFDPSKRGSLTKARSAKGATWFTDDPKSAGAYSVYAAEDGPIIAALDEADKYERLAQKTGSQAYWDKYDEMIQKAEALDTPAARAERRAASAKVLHADIPDDLDLLDVDAKGMTPQDLSADADIDSFLNATIREAKKQGKAGVRFRNLDDAVGLYNQPSTHYAIFDPSTVKILGRK